MSTQIDLSKQSKDGSLTSQKIANNAIDDSKVSSLSISKITGLSDDLLTYVKTDGSRPITGDLQINGSILPLAYKLQLPSTSLTFNGIYISITAGEALSKGNTLRIASDGKFYKTNATNSSGVPCIALSVDDISTNGTGRALILGYWRDDTKVWTVGNPVYLATTSGDITQTAPSTSGNQIQKVGVAVTSTTIYFNVDPSILELA